MRAFAIAPSAPRIASTTPADPNANPESRSGKKGIAITAAPTSPSESARTALCVPPPPGAAPLPGRAHARTPQKIRNAPSTTNAAGRAGNITGRVTAISTSSAPSSSTIVSFSTPKRFALLAICLSLAGALCSSLPCRAIHHRRRKRWRTGRGMLQWPSLTWNRLAV